MVLKVMILSGEASIEMLEVVLWKRPVTMPSHSVQLLRNSL